MPLVVPFLRFFVVFLNVYETFKTLKPPPPSARRGGQPSVRAITQRKRDLKGCLAVWVVWCCFAIYERTLDRILSVFLPFYSELKSMFLLFLVLTRAKGAEPLFLHILRPLIKPYATVLDPMLELSRDIGDFLLAVLQVPLDSSPWFPSWCTGKLEGTGDSSSGRTSSGNPARTNNTGIPICRSSIDNAADSRGSVDGHRKSTSTASLPLYSERPSNDPPQYSQTPSRSNGHQIWYPPAAAYPASSACPLSLLSSASEYHSPEWRTYPAFPSAYPPTPFSASASLPGLVARSRSDHRPISDFAYPPIPEDEQDDRDGLEKECKLCPGVVCSPSTHKMPLGVHNYQQTRQLDDDTLPDDSMCSSEASLSEDGFGVSLRTPHHSPQAIRSGTYSSAYDE